MPWYVSFIALGPLDSDLFWEKFSKESDNFLPSIFFILSETSVSLMLASWTDFLILSYLLLSVFLISLLGNVFVGFSIF